MKLILVCHGESDDPSEQLDLGHMGHSDLRLTRRGEDQARAVANKLAADADRGQRIAAVYTSPLPAAFATATVIAEALGMPQPGIFNELQTLTPEVLPSGAYDVLEALQDRAWEAVDIVRGAHAFEDNIVLVTHRLPVHAIVCKALSMRIEDYDRFRIEPGSITIVEARRQRDVERIVLGLLNETFPT